MPFLLQEMSIGRSPEASQISEALSPFRTESRTNFSLKCGGAGKDEAIYAFGMVLHALRKCKWARQQQKHYYYYALLQRQKRLFFCIIMEGGYFFG